MLANFDADELGPLIYRLENVASETGNCGRKVRRTLEQVFTLSGNTMCVLTLPIVADGPLSALTRMQIANKMASTIDLVGQTMKELPSGQSVRIAFSSLTEVENELYAALTLELLTVPEGVKAQQRLLHDVAFGLRRILAMASFFSTTPDVDFLRELFFECPLTSDKLQQYQEQAEVMASGNFADAEAAPIILVALAEHLVDLSGTVVRS